MFRVSALNTPDTGHEKILSDVRGILKGYIVNQIGAHFIFKTPVKLQCLYFSLRHICTFVYLSTFLVFMDTKNATRDLGRTYIDKNVKLWPMVPFEVNFTLEHRD